MRISRWGGGVALGLAVGALALAAPAAAESGHFPDAGWQLRQIATGGEWEPAAESAVTGPTTVELTKPDGDTGTSIETTNLGLEIAAGDTISVSYALDGADTAAGAIRMFYYDHPDGNTTTEAPTATAIADGSGTLAIEVAESGTVGTFGLTYDASNASAGTVTFSDLMVAGTPVLFLEPEPEPSPTAEPTVAPTTEPTADPEPSDPAAPGQGGGGDKPGLPVTGSPLPILVGGGAVAAGLGGLALWLTRRRGMNVSG